jgi:hypothetical protein
MFKKVHTAAAAALLLLHSSAFLGALEGASLLGFVDVLVRVLVWVSGASSAPAGMLGVWGAPAL